ncbi:histone deacetylation protein Rxt3-domain-containing protein [Cercophora newfieldiana]|uniref:Histone deacetylation protein Rxt3-domain-containing protein n=1 Tax=Cercophora newfieldiana TaxID=92897 RepID=A0AA39XZ32_9PEZI|nr:histone deacetylation protein Rxt3-domain-containing protein [Cercophora newfieldiana]
MDPRQQPPPQHPFSRNAASPFGRPNFAGSQPPNQQPYPNAAPHPPSSAPNYPDVHSRKPSDTSNFYPPSRQYPPEPGPMPPSTHSRHPSTSSITSGQPMNRGMPPPNSPPQQHPQQGHGPPGGHQIGGPYGLPPPRPPPVSVGPPTAFPRGRELPALESLPRTGSSGSSMSISSMLGGPPPPREPAPPPHYPPGPPPGVSGPSYSQSMHASPRIPATGPPEYRPYQPRPQTPERHRMYDARDPRANTAASPSGNYSTPEGVQRYGTPQAYPQRAPPMTAAEQAREQGRMPPGAVPPRPSSQPKSFPNTVPPRPMEMNRPPPNERYGHREELRPSAEYNPDRPIRAMKYEDDNRYMVERERQERERQEREMEFHEREHRERNMSGSDPGRQPHSLADYGRALEQIRPQPPYPRGPDPRDQQSHWPRGPYEPSRAPAPYDPAGHHPRHQEYPPATGGPPFNGHLAYGPSPVERHPHPQHPSHQPPPHQHGGPPPGPGHPQGYDSPDRQRVGMMHHDRAPPHQHPHQQHPQPRTREEAAVPPPSVAYGGAGQMYESPRNRSIEEISTPHGQHRGSHLLGIQEINRKGRISPLPQAVQGAQPQLAGPAGEPGIKSEFGRMFSGIGTGVGNMSSPVPPGAQLPYGAPGLLRREDSDNAVPEPLGGDVSAKGGREPNRGKRRKPKDEDIRGMKKAQAGSPLLVAVPRKLRVTTIISIHHHHHHHHALDPGSSPALGGNTPFKSVKGSTPIPSPTAAFAKDFPTTHHHGVPRSTSHSAAAHPHPPAARAPPPPPPSPPVVIPKPRQVATSKAVLESVANLPRTHLGDVLYDPILEPARLQDKRTGRPPLSGYQSNPRPLPWDLIEGKENCTLTMKIGKEHLTPASREEITSRRALWGTDVYTDDSDVIAACIHAGWIRGEWPEDVDVDLLGLDEGFYVSDAKDARARRQALQNGSTLSGGNPNILTEPPATGPMVVPENRDLHVTLLILPNLEKYASTTRYGIKSREWGGPIGKRSESRKRAIHDGISFMVTEIRWVTNGGTSQNRLRGKARRERIRKALREIELGPAWAGGARNGSEPRENGTPKGAEKVGEISGAWWKHSSKPPSEGDKENQPLGVKVPNVPKEPENSATETTEATDATETGDKADNVENETAETATEPVGEEAEKDATDKTKLDEEANKVDGAAEA